jgi:hypothetical protein
MKFAILALSLVVLSAPARAGDVPVTISDAAISSSPKVNTQEFPDGRLWMIEWRRDKDERQLNLVVMKANPGHLASNNLAADTLHMISFKEGLTEDAGEADVRTEDEGDINIWDGTARWLLGSELAERSPLDLSTALSSGNTPGKAERGPERRYCVSFSWLAHDETRSMGGAYCQVMPVGATPHAADMLGALALRFN